MKITKTQQIKETLQYLFSKTKQNKNQKNQRKKQVNPTLEPDSLLLLYAISTDS